MTRDKRDKKDEPPSIYHESNTSNDNKPAAPKIYNGNNLHLIYVALQIFNHYITGIDSSQYQQQYKQQYQQSMGLEMVY